MNENKNYIGVIFSSVSDSELPQLLSQMSKSQLEMQNKYFYIFSNNKNLKEDIINTYFKDTAFSNEPKEKELNLLKSIVYFICSEEYANSAEMKDKTVITPSEDSFYFSFNENHFSKFI